MDQILFSRVKSHNDQKAFEYIFNSHYAALCSYASGILGNHEDAKDIVNDCFMEFWNKRQSIEITSSLKSYLYIAVRNLSINQLRKRKQKVTFNSERSYPFYKQEEISDKIEQLQQLDKLEEQLKDAIESLPQQCRYIFFLNRYEQMSYKAIAEKLNLSVGTVKTQIARALKKIRLDFKDFKAVDQIFLFNLVRHF
ncbi:RNA polymerase sigma-70 factor [Sunxiuqinia sp. sy24]|uniref:RNA polymerase sigma-70 factor n=1 Tax=Sunxiuqinia sp. sy24 TaxID=3461495 RepID=UPI004045BAA9